MCRINPEHTEDVVGAAACLIRIQDQLLVTREHTSNKYALPGGKSKNSEKAQCTAHRQTWAKTGFNVQVGEYLGMDNDGLRYYQCTSEGNFVGQIQSFPVPLWAHANVDEILLINPSESKLTQWSDDSQLNVIRDMFARIEVE
jgi:8-oxo-dGTP pyrophosphatase MutT (NUDIX family)